VLRLGLISYGIYLYHAVIGTFLTTGSGSDLVPLPSGGLIAFVVHVVFLTALTVPVAMASWRWLERPMIGLSSRLSDRWRAQHPVARQGDLAGDAPSPGSGG
jgi:peptidoglycan/LPS O-acetylase OafA/YrhL